MCLVVFFIGSTSVFALTLQEKAKYAKFLTGYASELSPQEKEKIAKALIESATGLSAQEKAKYAKFLAGSTSDFTPQEKEKYSNVFIETALMISPQDKAKYANLPGVQNLKKVKPNGEFLYVVKMGTLAPKGVGWAAIIETIVNRGILKVTSGLIYLNWYYGGTMGDDQDLLAKMRNQQLQGGGFSGQGMLWACPEMALMELPFMFENYDEVEYIYSKLRPRINQWFERHGYHLVLLAEQDFDQVYSTKIPIKTPDDFRNSRVLTWYGLLEEKVLKAAGASPLPIRVPEVAASIRTGVCDAFISPSIWAVGTQMYSVMKYVNPMHIRYSPAGGVITMQTWNLLPEETRVAIDYYVMSIEKDFRRQVRESNEKCLKAMYKYGMKEVKMTPAEIDLLKKRLMPVWDEFAAKGYYTKAELAEVKALLAEYRAKNKKNNR
jgi:TRAP-type C4-dicarboxylate transport system substrate-binding protein